MNISEVLTPALIKIELQSEDKEELFEEMVQLFVSAGVLKDRAAALRALTEREAKMSTGVGNGLAIPHGKLEEANQLLMALGICRAGLDYDALDDQPVYIVLVVFAEIGNPGPHIEALAEISRLFTLPGFSARLLKAQSAEEVFAIIRQEE